MNLELYITKGEFSGHRKPITCPEKILIGRDATCDLSIADPLLSRQHCLLEVTPQGIKIIDLKSRNKTFVNGRPIAEMVLNFNDEVKVGRHAFQIVEGGTNFSPQDPPVAGTCSQCQVRIFQRDVQEMRAIRHGKNLYCEKCIASGIPHPRAVRPVVQQPTATEVQVPTFSQPAQAVVRPPQPIRPAPHGNAPRPVPNRSVTGAGTNIGPYQVLETLGEGGMGFVYKARHSILETIVAIKVIKEELASQDEVVKRFLREARLGVALNHENILQIIDAGQADGVYYIGMEYFEGKDLSSCVKKLGPFSPPVLIRLAVQMADALCHAHKHKVIHRDVKPSNILVDKNGKIKLADFGLAKAWQKAGAHQLTASGQMLGTIQYISPEQLEDARSVSPKTDIFSLGASLYFALTGNTPFGEEPLGKVIENILHNPPPPLSKIVPGIPPTLEAIIMKAMAKKSDERFKDMEEFKNSLVQLTA